jgi:hypothetical protein
MVMMNTVLITKEFVLSYSFPLSMKALLNKETNISHKLKKLLTPLKENPSLSYGLKEVNNLDSKNPSKSEDLDSQPYLLLPLQNKNTLFLNNLSDLRIFKPLSLKLEVENKFSTVSLILPLSKMLLNGMEKINLNLMNYDLIFK